MCVILSMICSVGLEKVCPCSQRRGGGGVDILSDFLLLISPISGVSWRSSSQAMSTIGKILSPTNILTFMQKILTSLH